ncbi:MAG: hypothetical protein KME17_06830 [Cyanosarcina radialis HA8281-LM2]|jgi:hypothetical protein|nr:hypothetical protein [Cyanosarcina radialis HA8281-LM2]
MTPLNPSTQRRLQQLPQIPSIWEGDRRPLQGLAADPDFDDDPKGECILWVDGVEGVVRAMEVVPGESGPEAIVRTLLRAIEHPQSPAKPARPKKIVVRDRQMQFYLRGVLQDLDIAIDYAAELPLIDELFRGFQEVANSRPPKLPPQYAELLTKKAFELWYEAPWEKLADHQIVAIEVNQWDVETLYASVMGMLGMEYGILFYRSLDSLKRFRSQVLREDSFEQMEEAFLGQDCLFVTFERADEGEDDDIDLADLSLDEIQPNFGTIHPLEGMRPFLYPEEAKAFYIALTAFCKFIATYKRQLSQDPLPALSKSFRLKLPPEIEASNTVSIKVATLPDLSSELLNMMDGDEGETEETSLPLRDDLVPEDAFLSLGMMPWENLPSLRSQVSCYQAQEIKALGDGLPVVLIQASRPKAKTMIENIQAAGGLKGICFNPGEDPFDGDRYDLGLLQAENGTLYLFGEFMEDDPVHIAARKKWEQRCQKTKGFCGLIIAKGLKGASRGNPKLNDIMALFEVRSISSKELGLGLLQRMPQFDFE